MRYACTLNFSSSCVCKQVVTMKLVVFFIILSLFLINETDAKSADEKRKAAADNSGKILTDLYITLRNIVFPKSPLSDGVMNNRFVLLSPGKVLNYWDYYPGEDYEESLLRQNTSAPEVMIPPAVAEKWFDIADVMVGADPFSGGVSGKSLARAYETIVSQMDILGIQTKSTDAQARYNMARDYLIGQVSDPDNLTLNSTRLALYDRYLTQYTQLKLDMEESIADARRTRGAVEYELWFQRNYPSLNSRVEGAYTKFLTFGDKNVVELYKAYLDSASAGSEIEDARMSLRGSGVSSLDRTRTIYPVSFEPGNWYKYLLPKTEEPSRDMLLARKSMLESERDSLKTMISFSSTNHQQETDTMNQLEDKLNTSTQTRVNKTNAAMTSRMDCFSQNANQPPPGDNTNTTVNTPTQSNSPCSNFKRANEEAVTATFQQAQVKSEYENAAFLLKSKDQFNTFLEGRISTIEREIKTLDGKLNDSSPYLGGIAESREFNNLNSIWNETEQSLDDAWTVFEYESDSQHINTDQETHSLNVAASLGVSAPGLKYGGQASAQYGKSTADLQQALNSANLKASGEVLRVVIKRPWFKPSIFDTSSLSFMQRDEANQVNTYVSPGPTTEKALRDAIGGTDQGRSYLFPEYVSSFLLARNIKLEFSGVDANSVSHGMQMMAGGSLSASYDMFTLGASVGIGKTKQSVNADRTTNGMIISIPGAQVIGYYTNVLPRFPRSQK